MSTPSVPAIALAASEPGAINTSGEGAQTALAAMIRKRRMGENHIEPEAPPAEQTEARPQS